jgi:2-polyprenyl-3-methyl-5-hydroxy-6-metoxy-1,4-benzoquinol methylase
VRAASLHAVSAPTSSAAPAPARWPFALPAGTSPEEVERLRQRVTAAGEAAQYGWGHTVDFGPFVQPGLLGSKYLELAGTVDAWGWWPQDLTGKAVADVGAFTGGLSLLLAGRGASVVHAVDEVPEHLEQCRLLAEAFDVDTVRPVQASLYDLTSHIEPESLDVVLLAGVLYHLSDMLVGLAVCARLLKPGGVLVVESNAVECYEHSYANFGRYFEGMWWQPTALCIQDMSELSGFERADVRFYKAGRALARMVKPAGSVVPFKRGVNLDFPHLRDEVERTRDSALMAPAPDRHADAALVRRVAARAGDRAFRRSLELGYRAARSVRTAQAKRRARREG